MLMEFKVIFYVLVAIGYFIYTNYKKLNEENRKRKFTTPVPPAASALPTVDELKTIIKKEVAKQRPDSTIKKPVLPKPVLIPLKKNKPQATLTSLDIQSLETIKPEGTPFIKHQAIEHETVIEKAGRKTFFDKKTFQNAVILGEIINKPAWTKY